VRNRWWLAGLRDHDAARTNQAFERRLRDELDLDALSAELPAVVHQTMEPTTLTPPGPWRPLATP
jgi:hypothetical protein